MNDDIVGMRIPTVSWQEMQTQTDLNRFFESSGYRRPFAAEKPIKDGSRSSAEGAHAVAQKKGTCRHPRIRNNGNQRQGGCGCCP